MDAILHDERLCGHAKRVHVVGRLLSRMPDGAIVGVEQDSFVLAARTSRRWTPSGYTPDTQRPPARLS